jgi:16S rRNA (guanine1516-N2)-methyltransferase
MSRSAARTRSTPYPPNVVVTFLAPAQRPAGCALAQSLDLPLRDDPSGSDLQLIHTAARLELHDPLTGARLHVQFGPGELRRYRASLGPDPLRRAIGPTPRHVVDATAGLGADAVRLAVLGYDVTAIERNGVVAALARDGLERARANGLLASNNPAWRTGDARLLLPELMPPADTVYLDPMFPPKRKKSAAARKEMRLLRTLVGDDADVLELFEAARACASDRVVVKRPVDAPPIAPNPKAAYRGKLIRYDVYDTRIFPAT